MQVGVTQVVSVRHASVQGFLRLVSWANGCRFAKFHASVCDCNFPCLVASLFSWQCLAASSFSSLHARKCVPNNVPGLSLSPSFSLSKHTPRHTVSYYYFKILSFLSRTITLILSLELCIVPTGMIFSCRQTT